MENEIKVRFNLGRGKNYKKWKVEMPGKKPVYYDPKKVQLVMLNSKLVNNRAKAEKIYKGACKQVCAWVCPEVLLVLRGDERHYLAKEVLNIVRYNPKVAPNWMYLGCNVDNKIFEALVTKEHALMVGMEE